jgi:hypothetical protein
MHSSRRREAGKEARPPSVPPSCYFGIASCYGGQALGVSVWRLAGHYTRDSCALQKRTPVPKLYVKEQARVCRMHALVNTMAHRVRILAEEGKRR